MTTFAEAAALSRANREAREAQARRDEEEALALQAAEELAEEEALEEEPGFFQSFFGRGETIDTTVEELSTGKKADSERQRSNQSTDSNN